MYYYTHLGNRYTIDDMVPNKTILNMIRDILDNGVDVYSSILDKKIDDNHTWIEQTNVRISEEVGTINNRITNEVETINDRITTEVRSVRDSLYTAVDKINKRVGEIRTDLNNKIEANDLKHTTAENQLSDEVSNINDSVSALQTKLNNLDNNNPNNVASGSRSTLQSYLVNANAAPDTVTAKSGLQNWVVTKNNAVNAELGTLDSRIQALEEGGGGTPSTQSHSMLWNFLTSTAKNAFINMDSLTYYYLPSGATGTEVHAGYSLIKTSDTTLRIIVTEYMDNTLNPTTTIISNVVSGSQLGSRVSVTASPYYLTLPTAVPLTINTNPATLYAPFPPFMTAISSNSWLPTAYHYLGSGILYRNLTGEITPARCLFYVAKNSGDENDYGILIPTGDGFAIGPKNVTIPF